jgi:tryptophan synthase alpha chain
LIREAEMSKIKETFDTLHVKGQKAVVGFVTAGDPTVVDSLEIVREMCRRGLDILELGVPFSDPTADGPVIQRSSARAIKAGVNMAAVLEMVRAIREFSSIPIVLFSYYNPILAYGAESFYHDSIGAGADGVLVVDLPPEESDELTGIWGNDLDLIRLVAPTTPPSRMAMIASKASGFIYLVSMTGVTGSGGLDQNNIATVAGDLRESSNGLPICIGFGISTPDQAEQMSGIADGIVIGSAFERIIESNPVGGESAKRVGELVHDLKEAIMKSSPMQTQTRLA